MLDKKNLAIVVPTYNEKDNIYNLIMEIGKNLANEPVYTQIIIVDDNSPDGTANVIKSSTNTIEKEFPNMRINLIQREGKLGLGTAYIKGFKEALEMGADYIMSMDADFSHQPKYLPDFIKSAKNYDVVIGSRYIKGGSVENWGIIRRFISMGGSLYARTILGVKVKDMTGGYNLYSSEVLKNIGLDNVKSNGYSFQLEMKYRSIKKGFKVIELPIIFPDRRVGKSKMSKKIFLEAMKMVWKLKQDKSI